MPHTPQNNTQTLNRHHPAGASLAPSLPAGVVIDPATGEILAGRQQLSTPGRHWMAAYLAQAGVSTLDYVEALERQRCDGQDRAARVATPGGGWPAFWRSLGVDVVAAQRTSRAPYLEQKAKPYQNPNDAMDTGFRTCGEGGIEALKGFAVTGRCEKGDHRVAKLIMCGREWCARCGVNAGPGVAGSMAHQRRIARWLAKAQQLAQAGYLTFTFPMALRDTLRDPAELSWLSVQLVRRLKYLGFSRGLRRWHFFGEPENGQGGIPKYHPHLNVVLDAGHIGPDVLDAIKKAFRRLLKTRYGYSGPNVVEYHYRTAPGEIYHMVRYITRATFKDAMWDEQLALALKGFRNQSSWGKWDGPALWQPEPGDLAPSTGAQRIVENMCPGDHPEPVTLNWQPYCRNCDCALHIGPCACGCIVPWPSDRVISASRLHTWQDLGAGYYMAAGPPGAPP